MGKGSLLPDVRAPNSDRKLEAAGKGPLPAALIRGRLLPQHTPKLGQCLDGLEQNHSHMVGKREGKGPILTKTDLGLNIILPLTSSFTITNHGTALAGVAQWIECQPANQRVAV